MAFQLRQKAQADRPKPIGPDHAQDLAKVSAYLIAGPPISEQSLPQLIRIIAVLSRMLDDADRPADLHCTAMSKEWMETAWDPDDELPVKVHRYGTKTKKTSWMSFQVIPLNVAELRAALGVDRARADDLVNYCCLACAWKTYLVMIQPYLRRRLIVHNFEGRWVYAQSALVYGRTNFESQRSPRFLSVDRLTNIVRNFHLEHVGSLQEGSKHVTYWWRHYVLSTLYAMGEKEAVLRASEHKSIRTFLRSYQLPPNPQFMERWRSVSKRRRFPSCCCEVMQEIEGLLAV